MPYQSDHNQANNLNWMHPNFSSYTFSHVSQFLPTDIISRKGNVVHFELHPQGQDLSNLLLEHFSGKEKTLQEIMTDARVDAFLVLKDGKIFYEKYLSTVMHPNRAHAWFSGTKSLTALAFGILAKDLSLDLEKNITDYVPELLDSAFERVSIRNLLDMSSALSYIENFSYINLSQEEILNIEYLYQLHYLPRTNLLDNNKNSDIIGIYEFLSYIKANLKLKPGEKFEYASLNADVLGFMIEKLSHKSYNEFITENIWEKLGVSNDGIMSLDLAAKGVATGGFSSTLRDAGRFLQMILNKGSFNDRFIIPETWIEDSFSLSDKNKTRMKAYYQDKYNGKEFFVPFEGYKNFWWILDDNRRMAKGLYGQFFFIDQKNDLATVCFSSNPSASSSDSPQLQQLIYSFPQISDYISSL